MEELDMANKAQRNADSTQASIHTSTAGRQPLSLKSKNSFPHISVLNYIYSVILDTAYPQRAAGGLESIPAR